MAQPHDGTSHHDAAVRLTPLLSDEGRAFLAGDVSAAEYLEQGRRRAAHQALTELLPYARRPAIAALVTSAIVLAMLTIGTAYYAATGRGHEAIGAFSAGLASAAIVLSARTRLRRTHTPTLDPTHPARLDPRRSARSTT